MRVAHGGTWRRERALARLTAPAGCRPRPRLRAGACARRTAARRRRFLTWTTPAGFGPHGGPQKLGRASPRRRDRAFPPRSGGPRGLPRDRGAHHPEAMRRQARNLTRCFPWSRFRTAKGRDPFCRKRSGTGIRPAGTSARRARPPPPDPAPANRSLAISSAAGPVGGG